SSASAKPRLQASRAMAQAAPTRMPRLEPSVVRWARSMDTTTSLGRSSPPPFDTLTKSGPSRCLFETSIIEAIRPCRSSGQELHPEPPLDGSRDPLCIGQRDRPHGGLAPYERRDDLLVLLRQHRAGGIEQSPPGGEHGQRRTQDGQLCGRKGWHIGG